MTELLLRTPTTHPHPAPTSTARNVHRRLPEYAASPLRELPAVAAQLGLGSVWAKDESSRLGLPAFKILGASWASYRGLSKRLGHEPKPWTNIEELAEAFASLRPLTLATATDGNHGRAVARAARWYGISAHIYIPKGTAAAREDAIRSEGAEVTVVDGSYDDAVAMAAASAGPDTLIVSDTSWDGYTEIPTWVTEGYETIFAEADEQLAEAGATQPNAVFMQVGVGTLAAAVVNHYKIPGRGTKLVAFEPETAACLIAALEADEIVTVPGPQTSIMAGMNCGTVSQIAWPVLRDGIDAAMTVSDDSARTAMRAYADAGIVSGETGASGLAALMELLRDPAADRARSHLGLGPESSVLVFSTEGATDPVAYEQVVGHAPETV
jgi:diaminopropionate ammonia-lyase